MSSPAQSFEDISWDYTTPTGMKFRNLVKAENVRASATIGKTRIIYRGEFNLSITEGDKWGKELDLKLWSKTKPVVEEGIQQQYHRVQIYIPLPLGIKIIKAAFEELLRLGFV